MCEDTPSRFIGKHRKILFKKKKKKKFSKACLKEKSTARIFF